MTRLDHASEITDLAAELGVCGSTPVDGVLDFCRRRIDGLVAEAGSVTGIEALESLVVQRLQLVFEEIRCDEDFDLFEIDANKVIIYRVKHRSGAYNP